MKSVPDFIPDHIGDRDVLVLGMNPSTNKRPIKNGTFCKLKDWMDKVGVPHWDFHNVVPDKTGEVKVSDVDYGKLWSKVKGRKVVICLGGFVRRVIDQIDSDLRSGITFVFVDHPSSRNRNFNDPEYEPAMLKRLKKELKEAGVG